MPLLFAVTLFVSAFLLFLVQPMIGKMILPRLGGTPAVWNTCMVFFQAVLLAGYAYTHTVTTWLPTRRQLLLQCGVLALPFLFLPFAIDDWAPPTESNPVFALLFLLLLVVGLPFLIVATSAPLLQKWFSHTGHPAAKDPYFLYGASNLGSMLALLAYPLLIEPNLSVPTQSALWTWSYALFIALTLACAAVVWLAPAAAAIPAAPAPAPAAPPSAEAAALRPARKGWRGRKEVAVAAPARPEGPPPEVTPLRRLRWVGLAAAPSSLMLGVTTYLTTDIAAIPLFWVVPLALYLLSFILVFLRWPVEWTKGPHTTVLVLQPLSLFVLALINLIDVVTPQWQAYAVNLLAFFLTALLCHGELARDRPSTRYLTEFYLWMSVGGVLGGLFNALLAPLLFNRHLEYMLMLALSCLLRPPTRLLARLFRGEQELPAEKLEDYLLDVGYAVCMALFTFALLRLAVAQNLWGEGQSFHRHLYKTFDQWRLFGSPEGNAWAYYERVWAIAGWVSGLVVAGLPLLVCLMFAGRPLRFGLCALAFFLANGWYTVANERAIFAADGKIEREGVVHLHRSFFGTHRVRASKDDKGNEYTVLVHGGIDHGRQFRDAARRDQPISYFYPAGPIGQIFTAFSQQEQQPPYAVLGLGVGSLASYAREGQHAVFYEIDPAVKRLSQPAAGAERYFHYLHDAEHKKKARVEVILGDGRLRLQEAKDGYYHILVMDAFSSDAIPMHLLTLEAVDLYLRKLADGGILIFNVTNRYVSLPPVLGDLAAARGLRCLYQADYARGVTAGSASDWVIMVKPRTERKAVAAEAAQLLGATSVLGGPAAVPWAAVARAPQLDVPPLLLRLDWSKWLPCKRRHGPEWTDDYSNLLGVLIW